MVVGAELRYFVMRLENGRFSDPMYCKKPRSKFAWLGRTFESCNEKPSGQFLGLIVMSH
jgi:hypothetical protein